jgi:pimeloyl-ACP methyl ester carboxylesterase
LWRDFPSRLAAATGARVVAYSRYGYGRSDRLSEPRAVDYMHQEALRSLPEVRERLGIVDPVLIGHSDGASIAAIHAGAARWPVRGLVLMAPHVFVEEVSVASIEEARAAYRTTDLPRRLGRHHEHVDEAFYGWNDVWLHPDFRAWNIEEYLPGIACPTLLIQGEGDEYGTIAQLDAIRRQVTTRVEQMLLPNCGHSPFREQPEATLDAIARFVDELARGVPGSEANA